MVVAAIIKKDNFFLIVQRNKDKHLGLKWEFPGGKVQTNETHKEALTREIKEELNIKIDVHEKNIVLHYFLCTHKSGSIELNEHENFYWVKKNDFNKYDFAEGDGNILSLL